MVKKKKKKKTINKIKVFQPGYMAMPHKLLVVQNGK